MSTAPDSHQDPNNEPRGSSTEAWEEVGRQFKLLGESISQAFQAAWHYEENRKRMEEVRTGLESMVSEVNTTIKEAANTPQGQRFREQSRQAAQEFRTAGEQAAQDLRPHLVSALK